MSVFDMSRLISVDNLFVQPCIADMYLYNIMQVLGIPNYKLQDEDDPEGSAPEHKEHTLSGLPGHDITDQAHASKTLSKLRANFQSVSYPLHERLACS